MKHIFLKFFFYILLLPICFTLNANAFTGAFLGRVNFDFAVPFIFVSKEDSSLNVETTYSDYYFDRLSIPFHVSSDLAYLAIFAKEHKLMTLWKIEYTDDPINFLFDSDTKSKINAANSASQSLNNFILLKYIWSGISFVDIAYSVSGSLNLNRESKIESFLNNYYNNHIYTTSLDLSFKDLGKIKTVLQPLSFKTYLSYSYNYFPNSKIAPLVEAISSVDRIPTSKEDYHNISFKLESTYNFFNKLLLTTSYRLAYSQYSQKPVHTGDTALGYSDQNESIRSHYINLNAKMNFIKRNDYHLLNLIFLYQFQYYDSNYVEYIEIGHLQKGNYPVPLNAISVNNKYIFYQKDFKDYFSNIFALSLLINITQNNGINIGYSTSIKNFYNLYGRSKRTVFANDPADSLVTSSGENFSQKIDSLGIYTGEKRMDLYHTITFGYIWLSPKKDRKINPYVGIQFSDSNDHIKKINRHIFLIGTKLTYEF